MGDPVDYSVYLMGRLTDSTSVIPDFNLDSDSGYGYHCWDWKRPAQGTTIASQTDCAYDFVTQAKLRTQRFTGK